MYHVYVIGKARLWLLGFSVAPYGLLVLGAGTNSPATTQLDKPSFTRDVLAVVKANCVSCHSGNSPSGGLNLASAEGFLKGGESGKAFVAKDATRSLIIQRLRGEGGLPRMPMGFAPLPKEQIDRIAGWIDAGAVVEKGDSRHWAYVRPTRPAEPTVPKLAPPGWHKNPIDAFVYARLTKEGLRPSPEAPRETLIRRVSLDLTGLPPTPREIDAFLADKRPDAYERLVDRLLASPHYGERQARPWLDLARYADSDGYEKDLNRTAWKYRDWVIAAFNRNMPYDEFTVEQLAGDLMPNPTLDKLIATGFNRNTMFNREGGVDQEEAHFGVVLDRVSTTSTVWLGTTLGCARCHDHKYDPFTQKDHYRMAAFFSNAVILPRGPKEVGEEKWFEPEIDAGTPEQMARRSNLMAQVTKLEKRLADTEPLRAGFEKWIGGSERVASWHNLEVGSAKASGGASLTADSSGAIVVQGANPPKDTYTIRGRLPVDGASALRIEALPDGGLANKGPGRADNGNFVLTGVTVKLNGRALKLNEAVADFAQQDFPAIGAIDPGPGNGWAVNTGQGKPHELVIEFADSAREAGEVEITLEQQSVYAGHNLGRFRLSFTAALHPLLSVLPDTIAALAANTGRTPAENKVLLEHYRSIAPELRDTRLALADTRKALDKARAEVPTALVMMDKPSNGPLTAWLRTRGEFLSKAELVTAGTPAVLPALQKKGKVTRLDLARWLVDKRNPLTARVEVNRMWEQYFGRGIVETSEDFGTQGARPTHPELLDWLACEFMSNGWNMKAMHRLIVTSATYKQSSDIRPDLLKKDPQNLLMARGPRFRMEAEMIRDSALAASGLLNRKIGGPSVYPFQPEGVWDNPFSNERWMTSSGGDQYRRGLYTFLKRTAPYASFLTFDTTSREFCTVRRIRTNTPLQALAMLNDGAVFDTARALGARMIKEGGPSTAGRVTYGFRLCTARRPSEAELSRLERLVESLTAKYSRDPAAAKKLASSPEQAVWTMVANVLLNLDEAITKN